MPGNIDVVTEEPAGLYSISEPGRIYISRVLFSSGSRKVAILLSYKLDRVNGDHKYNYCDAGFTDKDIRNLRIVSAREAAEGKHRTKIIELTATFYGRHRM